MRQKQLNLTYVFRPSLKTVCAAHTVLRDGRQTEVKLNYYGRIFTFLKRFIRY